MRGFSIATKWSRVSCYQIQSVLPAARGTKKVYVGSARGRKTFVRVSYGQ
jgi:hypothetical protein